MQYQQHQQYDKTGTVHSQLVAHLICWFVPKSIISEFSREPQGLPRCHRQQCRNRHKINQQEHTPHQHISGAALHLQGTAHTNAVSQQQQPYKRLSHRGKPQQEKGHQKQQNVPDAPQPEGCQTRPFFQKHAQKTRPRGGNAVILPPQHDNPQCCPQQNAAEQQAEQPLFSLRCCQCRSLSDHCRSLLCFANWLVPALSYAKDTPVMNAGALGNTVQSRQAGFVRCCLKQKADEHLSCSPAFLC